MPPPEGAGQGGGRQGAPSLEARLSVFDNIGKSIDGLVDSVKQIPTAVKEAAHYTYYAAKAAAGLATGALFAGTFSTFVLPIGMAAGTLLANWKNKEKKPFRETYKQMANELCIGGLLGGVLHYMFEGVSHIGKFVKSAYGFTPSMIARGASAFATLPAFLGTHEYLNRAFISDYEPQPLEIGKKMKGPMKWIIPPILANFTVIPEYLGPAYQMPTAAGISLAYGMLKSPPKKEEKEQPIDQNQLARAMQQYGGAPRPE